MLTGHLGFESRITSFPLAVAKDSGWYTVDTTMGEYYEWGKDKGCNFLDTSCLTNSIPELCSTVDEYGCSDDHLFRTRCSSNLFNASCPINFYKESCKIEKDSTDPEFTYGRTSVCLLRQVFIIYYY